MLCSNLRCQEGISLIFVSCKITLCLRRSTSERASITATSIGGRGQGRTTHPVYYSFVPGRWGFIPGGFSGGTGGRVGHTRFEGGTRQQAGAITPGIVPSGEGYFVSGAVDLGARFGNSIELPHGGLQPLHQKSI